MTLPHNAVIRGDVWSVNGFSVGHFISGVGGMLMAATVLHIDEIVSDPKIRSGRPVIRGTGIRVIDVVAYHLGPDKQSPQQLAKNFRLPLGQIHAALAYYYLHKEEVEADMRSESERAEMLAAELEAQGRLTRVEVDLEEP